MHSPILDKVLEQLRDLPAELQWRVFEVPRCMLTMLGAGRSLVALYRARRACCAQIAGLGTGLRDPNKTWTLAVSGDEASQAPDQVQ